MNTINKYKKKNNQRRKMTCIIGGKCNDGVVLIADKKIKDPNTNSFEFREKLFVFKKDYFYYPIVVGSSGTIPLYEKFKRDAIEVLQKINPDPASFSFKSFTTKSFDVSGMIYPHPSMSNSSKEVVLYPYIEKLEGIIKKFKKDYTGEEFDVLFAAQVEFRGAILSYISEAGLSEDISKHKTIGSGEIPASVFLNILNPNEMTMKEFAKWGYFIIKHIEEYGIDDKVGVGKELPQIYFIPNQGQLYQAQNDFLDCCEKSRKHMEENLKNLLAL